MIFTVLIESLEFSVQCYKLFQEASVGKNPAFLLHAADSGQETVMLMNHQVGQDHRSRATYPDSTVHKHLSWKSRKAETERCFFSMSSVKESMWGFTAWGQSSVNELSSRVKERWEVKCRQVTGGNSIVFHCGPIKVIISLAAEFPMCSVQDMGDSQLPEPQLVVRHEPDTQVMHV